MGFWGVLGGVFGGPWGFWGALGFRAFWGFRGFGGGFWGFIVSPKKFETGLKDNWYWDSVYITLRE